MKHTKLEKTLESDSYKKANNKAMEYLKNPQKLKLLLDGATEHSANRSFANDSIFNYFNSMCRLLKAYYKGEYKQISTNSIIAVMAAIIYFVIPTDFIPDAIVGLGLIDDITVIQYTLNFVKSDIDAFLQWENSNS